MDIEKLFKQSTWRKAGAATIILATLMALYSLPSDVLRDSVIHMAHLFSEDATNDIEPSRSFLACFLYWSVFALLIVMSLYLALVDIKYIRLHYALEKQKLFRQTMGNDLFDDPPIESNVTKPALDLDPKDADD